MVNSEQQLTHKVKEKEVSYARLTKERHIVSPINRNKKYRDQYKGGYNYPSKRRLKNQANRRVRRIPVHIEIENGCAYKGFFDFWYSKELE